MSVYLLDSMAGFYSSGSPSTNSNCSLDELLHDDFVMTVATNNLQLDLLCFHSQMKRAACPVAGLLQHCMNQVWHVK